MEIIKASSKSQQNAKICIYGPPGIGKTTLGSKAPNPLLINLEDGAKWVQIDSTPVLKSYDEVCAAMRLFINSDYITAVIDTLDVLECLIYEHLCRKNSWASIETPGYGRGYSEATETWIKFLDGLDNCNKRGKNILCLAHEQIKPYKGPDADSYDRYMLKLNPKSANIIEARMDAVLFAQQEMVLVRDKANDDRYIGKSSGKRILRTTWAPAWQAKNRMGLDPVLPLDETVFQKVFPQ